MGIEETGIYRLNERVEGKRNRGQAYALGLELSVKPWGGAGLQEKTEPSFGHHPERAMLGHPSRVGDWRPVYWVRRETGMRADINGVSLVSRWRLEPQD